MSKVLLQSTADFEIDDSKVINLFKQLDFKNQKKSLQRAMRESGKIIVKQARKNLRAKMGRAATRKGKYGTSMSQGIKVSVQRDLESYKVHVMGEYRLKWFEKGTVMRKQKSRSYKKSNKKTKGGNTGKITALYFFKSAWESKKKEAADSLMSNIYKNIQKIKDNSK